MEITLKHWDHNDNDTGVRDRRITLLCDGVERVADAYSDGDGGYDWEFISAEDKAWYEAQDDDTSDDISDLIEEAYMAGARLMTKETHEHLTAILEYYSQTSSGREQENAEATEKAWNEINRLAGIGNKQA